MKRDRVVRTVKAQALAVVASISLEGTTFFGFAQVCLGAPEPTSCAVAPDAAHARETRAFVGIPSVAVSPKNGRLWRTWYGGPTPAEDKNNYCILATSTDGGCSWTEVLVADPDGTGPRRSFDPNVFVAPDGLLRWTWAERVGAADDPPTNDRLMMAELSAEDLPAGPVTARRIARGVMMNKPVFLSDGTWLLPVSNWFEDVSAGVWASTDGGRTFVRRGGVAMPQARRGFDEHNLIVLTNGNVRAYVRARAPKGFLGNCLFESESADGGFTWSDPRECAIGHTSSRLCARRGPDGLLYMAKHGDYGVTTPTRTDLKLLVSPDEGVTWKTVRTLDAREKVSYPDFDFQPDGSLFVVWDHDRTGLRDLSGARVPLVGKADGGAVAEQARQFRFDDIVDRRILVLGDSISQAGDALRRLQDDCTRRWVGYTREATFAKHERYTHAEQEKRKALRRELALPTDGPARSLEAKVAAEHQILVSDDWGGGHRIVFDFGGRRAWIVEPSEGVAVDAEHRWVWTMQWMGAYLNRTGAPDLVRRGWRHVHLEAFDTRANAEGLKALAAFHDYLVRELGFAPKANLIGMSWGGFYSVRYANAYPDKVAKLYLDAPLLTFDGFGGDSLLTPTKAAATIGPWADAMPPDGEWLADARMPVNMAASIAAAKIPVYLLYGGQDQTVRPQVNCERFAEAFKAAGGALLMEKRPLYGHHPHGFEHEDISKILNYFLGL